MGSPLGAWGCVFLLQWVGVGALGSSVGWVVAGRGSVGAAGAGLIRCRSAGVCACVCVCFALRRRRSSSLALSELRPQVSAEKLGDRVRLCSRGAGAGSSLSALAGRSFVRGTQYNPRQQETPTTLGRGLSFASRSLVGHCWVRHSGHSTAPRVSASHFQQRRAHSAQDEYDPTRASGATRS